MELRTVVTCSPHVLLLLLPRPCTRTPVQTLHRMATHDCLICDKSYSVASNLYRHMRQRHNEEPPLRPHKGPQLPCPICRQEHKSRRRLHEHLSSQHSITVASELLVFQTMDGKSYLLCDSLLPYNGILAEFNNWKEQMELRTKTTFSRSNLLKSAGKTMIYFYCGRSGHLNSCSTGARKLKRWGSRKMGAVCPAQITLCHTHDKQIDVQFISTHVGHDFEEIHCHGYLRKYGDALPSVSRRSRQSRSPVTNQTSDEEQDKSQETSCLPSATVNVAHAVDNEHSDETHPDQMAMYQLVRDQTTDEPVYILQMSKELDARVNDTMKSVEEHDASLVEDDVSQATTSQTAGTSVIQCNMCPASVYDLRQHYHHFHKISLSKIELFMPVQ